MNVAFEIDEIDPVRQEGLSVLVRGTLHHVDADAAAFRHRFDPEPWLLAERDAWLLIEPLPSLGADCMRESESGLTTLADISERRG